MFKLSPDGFEIHKIVFKKIAYFSTSHKWK